jgi:hypothetical protein
MPTSDELISLPVHWLTSDLPWDPTLINETYAPMNVPLGYSSQLGTINLTSLHFDLTNLGEMGELTETTDEEIAQTFSFLNQCQVFPSHHIYLSTALPKPIDYEHYRPFLAWKPLEVIKKTFAATTQWAMQTFDAPLKCHFKSRFPSLNRPRLWEMFCTDTWFGSTPAIGGYTCAQLYYGVKSKYMVLYPMHKESDGPDTLEDLCRYHGAPVKIKNDNAQMEVGTTWTTICRKYNIEQARTEPHHPWQNEAERYIQEVKKTVNTIMDRVGCPNKFWALCSLYVVFLLNRIANPELNWKTPMEACFGITPDLSPLLMHSFYDKVYYLDAEVPFPQSKEKLGRFVGIAENTGDALTFLVYTKDYRASDCQECPQDH